MHVCVHVCGGGCVGVRVCEENGNSKDKLNLADIVTSIK